MSIPTSADQLRAIASRFPNYTGLLAEAVVDFPSILRPERGTIVLRCPVADPGDNHIQVANIRMQWSSTHLRWSPMKASLVMHCSGELCVLLEAILDMYYDEIG